MTQLLDPQHPAHRELSTALFEAAQRAAIDYQFPPELLAQSLATFVTTYLKELGGVELAELAVDGQRNIIASWKRTSIAMPGNSRVN